MTAKTVTRTTWEWSVDGYLATHPEIDANTAFAMRWLSRQGFRFLVDFGVANAQARAVAHARLLVSQRKQYAR